MKNLVSPKIILILALIALVIPVTAIECYVLRHTAGHFMYPLDDTFIHMALARNLAFYGNWGMNPYTFASASSSVFYTLLLAGLFKIFSVHVLIPFLVNCVTGVVLLMALQRWLQREKITGKGQLVILFCAVLLTPLPILLICGMEHTLQCLFSFLFIFGFAEWLEGVPEGKGVTWKLPWSLLVYGVMVTFIRYEGLFLVAIACLILAWHRKISLAFKLGAISVLPLVIFGLYSLGKGSYFLPNSVLLKSDGAPLSVSGMLQYLDNIFVQRLTVVKTDNIPAGTPRPGISLLATQRLLIILPVVYLLFLEQIRRRRAYTYIFILLLGGTVMQLCFASTGWLYRYEAYLIFCSGVIVSVLVWKYGREILWKKAGMVRWMVVAMVFALCFPILLRSVAAFSKTGTACVNIYQQQYQMGQFLHTYYDKSATAANDIGAVSFFTSGPNVDLWGLGDIKVAKSRKKHYWTPDFLDSLCRSGHVGTAVVYEKWFNDSLLCRWNKVATWHIENNVICGDDTVSFFSTEKAGGPVLKQHLQEFETRLPAGVTVKYY